MAMLTKKQSRQRRHKRLRRNLSGTGECPRLTVFVSDRHLRVQLIDDDTANTLAFASTDEKEHRSAGMKSNLAGAAEIGRIIAERATAKGIGEVVFDRSGFKYHGIVQAVADAARENGLTF
jgi:large subunit ribosomal protein L18